MLDFENRVLLQADIGNSHVIAELNDGKVIAWGINKFKVLGHNVPEEIYRNAQNFVEFKFNNITQVTAYEYNCAVIADGKVYYWGKSMDTTSKDIDKPLLLDKDLICTKVKLGKHFVSVVSGGDIYTL